ncbi:hypothetical protein [Selenomonas sp. oral taxon 138]|uniref:hypothetical protein n=1 Tax=Selenomonas sp. oral taxon 138 TaxID=712532 RepID=UPI0002A206BF|nr:hypothetical protein [Selenomonas sp. oral taxon 138]EKX97839.1 hypothetical protein HMPREF9163_01228 [Selenomonas sp. oral taxon 138 str. F0429]
MKLKKLIAAAMVGSLTFTTPLILPQTVQSTLGAQAEAAKGGARIAPKAAPKAAPAAPAAQSGSQSKSVSGNGEGYAPSKNASQLDKNAPAAGAKANTPGAANAANAAQRGTGWGNTLRNIGLLAGGMMLGGLLASMFGMGGGMFADILGVLANVAMVFVAFIAIRWLWNRFRGRKEENVYQNAARPAAAPQPPITDIRPQGAPAPRMASPAHTQMDVAGESPRMIADRYRNR